MTVDWESREQLANSDLPGNGHQSDMSVYVQSLLLQLISVTAQLQLDA